MLVPSRVKYRKRHTDTLCGKDFSGSQVSFGEYGLKSVSLGRITSRQIESARIAISRQIKRGGKVWIRIFPHKPVTRKPAETRMGKGKGSPEFWVAEVRPGRVLFEMSGIEKEVAKKAFYLASYKLPVKTKFISRNII